MQGEVKIVFKTNAKLGSKTNVSSEGKISLFNGSGDDTKDRFNAYAIKTVVNAVKTIVINEVEYETKKYYDLTDNVRAQKNRQIALGVIDRVGNVVSSTASGFIAGGIIGAIIGFGASLVKEGINIYQGYDKQEIEMAKKNAQLQYTRESLGYSLVGGEKGTNR